jgi:oxygen-dependent protoporphyrinogen oxidase
MSGTGTARVPVVVVGGGITGLAAAWELRRRGVDFRLLEAGSRWGGVIVTDTVDGFVLEGGPDSMLAQKPEGVALCRELGLGERLVPTNPVQRTVYVLRRRRLHALPDGMVLAIPTRITPFVRSRLFPWAAKLRMGLDLLIPARHDPSDESIARFLRRRLGQVSVDLLGEPLLAGIHAGDPERLSMRATFPRFVELERRYGSLIRGMWASRRPAASAGPPPVGFYSLVGGLAEMVETLVSKLPTGSLRLRTPIQTLAREGGRFLLGVGDGSRLEADAVVMAVPGPRAAPLLSALLPDAAPTLAAIPFASTATVLLGYRRDAVRHPLDGYGMVIPVTEGLRTSACSFVSTKFPRRAPEGHVLLRGFLGGIRDPGALDLDDRAMVEIVRREMADVLGLTGEPVMRRVYRWPNATPQLEVGHLERIGALERRVSEVPGLFLTGAGLRVTGIPDCVAEGTRNGAEAAAYVAAGPERPA